MNKFNMDYIIAIGFIFVLCLCALVFVIVSLCHMDFVGLVAGGSILFALNGALAHNLEEYRKSEQNGKLESK